MNNNLTGAVTSSGEIRVNDGQSRSVGGSYTQAAGGALVIGATDAASHGQLVVTGAADFSGSNSIHVDVGAGATLSSGEVLADVVSAGSITGATINVTDNSALVSFTGAVDGATVDVTANVGSVATTTGGAGDGVAAALDAIVAGAPTGDAA